MQTRPHLEALLQEKIICGNAIAALQLIAMFKDDTDARLDSIDKHGKSFLIHALTAGMKDVADKLLLLQLDNPILFREDQSQNTAFFIAIKQGYTDIVQLLLNKSIEADQYDAGYKIWLKYNSTSDTPLHIAAHYRRIEVVKLLLTQLKTEPGFVNFINWSNTEGNTPLHLACGGTSLPGNEDLLLLLTENSANLALRNKAKQTPFDVFCQQPRDEQTEFFKRLKLKYYRDRVINEPENEQVLDEYYQVTSLHSLQAYVGAKLEFDDNIEISNFYSGRDMTYLDKVVIENKEIPDYILGSIPLYKRKLINAIRNNLPNELNSSEEESDVYLGDASYQILNKDQDSLLKIIEEVESYLAVVQTRPAVYLSGKDIQLLLSIMATIAYIAIETWLIVMTVKTFWPILDIGYFSSCLCVGIFGGVASAWILLGSILDRVIPSNNLIIPALIPDFLEMVSRDEWKIMIDSLQKMILDKLHFLEEKAQEDRLLTQDNNISYLPVSSQTVRNLEANLAEFDTEEMAVSSLVDLLKRLDAILITIQKGMDLTNKPLTDKRYTMFYKERHVVVDISESNSLTHSGEEVSEEDSFQDDERSRMNI